MLKKSYITEQFCDKTYKNMLRNENPDRVSIFIFNLV